MGILQRLITSFVSKGTAQALEAESRKWMLQCPCGAEQSIWAIGGIRYKAYGAPRVWRRCAKCGKRKWHRIYYAASATPTTPT